MFGRMVRGWVNGALPAALLLLVLTPLATEDWPDWRVAVWLLIPVYMLHQVEEWDDDRFLTFFNDRLFGGQQAVTQELGFWVNVVEVWSGFALILWLTEIRPGLGLMAAYALLLNAVLHLALAVWLRAWNPGLLTALTLFPAVGGYAVVTLSRAGATAGDHLAGLAVAVAGHAAIQVAVRLHLARHDRQPPSP
jgi:hypothetical protein